MHLKRLEIQGFKSFASKTVLDFLPARYVSRSDAGGPPILQNSITAIVGPNGAGKSNITDAMRWVMGETSLKNIRGKKSEDIIFSGSESKGGMGMAEVVMVLDNGDGSITNFSEITIARRLYRSGESEFLINNHPVRLLDVHLLLAQLRFSQQAYSIISQGMIDRLLTVTPAERKDFFDEACGIKEHQIKQHQAELKLARTEENMRQAEILLVEVEPRLRLLSRQVKKLEKRQEVESELKETQERFYAIFYWRNKKEIDRAGSLLGQTNERYRAAFTALEQAQNELSALARQSTRQEIFNELQGRHSVAAHELNEASKQLAILEGQLKIEYSQRGEQNIGWLTNKIADLKKSERRLWDDKERAATERDASVKRAGDQRRVIEGIQREITELKATLSRLRVAPFESADGNSISFGGGEASGALAKAKERLGQIGAIVAVFQEETKKYEVEFLGLGDVPERAFKNAELRFSASLISHRAESAAELQAALKSAGEELALVEQRLAEHQDRSVALEVTAGSASERLKLLDAEHTSVAGELASLEQELELAQTSPKEFNQALARLAKEKETILAAIERQQGEIKKIEKEIAGFNAAEEAKKERIFYLQNELQKRQAEVNGILNERNDLNIELAKVETKQEDLAREVDTEMNAPLQSIVARLGRIESARENEGSELKEKIQKLKYQLSLIGGIDEEVATEYQTTKERYDFLTGQLTDLRGATSDLNAMIEELDELMKKKRAAAFKKIRQEFDRYFKILFGGGKADLEEVYGPLSSVEDFGEAKEGTITSLEGGLPAGRQGSRGVLAETHQQTGESILTGIEVIANPPGKKVRYLNMLSGGERTLTSIALICAILHNNPSPFVVLDEVEAALDEANTLRFAKIMAELATQSQFIVVTHNRVTMHAAHALYGVVMGPDGASRLLSVKLEDVPQYEG